MVGMLLHLICYIPVGALITGLYPCGAFRSASDGAHKSGAAVFRMVGRLARSIFADVIAPRAMLRISVFVEVGLPYVEAPDHGLVPRIWRWGLAIERFDARHWRLVHGEWRDIDALDFG
jgi:hypothetical protein